MDATIIAAPSSTKNATGERDPEMHQTKKGNQWYFGMKAHIGVDAGTGYGPLGHRARRPTSTTWTRRSTWCAADDEVVYGDAGYQGAHKRPEIAGDEQLSRIEWRIAARKAALKTMAALTAPWSHARPRCAPRSSIRSWSSNATSGSPRPATAGIGKNLNHLHMLFASANWLMRARAVALAG